MSNFQDWSVGISAAEASFGAVATIARHLEFTEPKPFGLNRGVKQGAGIRPGTRVARSARRVRTIKQASGDITVEAYSKGLGLLLAACMGSGSSSVVSGAVYQQLFTMADILPSHNIQFGVPNSAGAIRPLTFRGCTVGSWELGGSVGDIATLKTSWDARDWDTSTAYVTPSYPTGGGLYTVEDATIYTGAFTAPTATVLASAATAVAGVKDFKVSLDNKLLTERFYANGGGLKDRQLPGTRAPAVELSVDYGANDLWDAIESDLDLSLVITLVGAALATGNETIQVSIPVLRPEDDGLPQASSPDELASQALKLTGMDGQVAAQQIWVVTRTTDTAL